MAAETGDGGASAGEGPIDWLVLTAANRAQARGYERQLETRTRDGRLAGVRNWMVVPDPCDRRIGSGGSTVTVLRELARRSRGRSAFDGLGIVIIHSGGDSRRLPAYAAEGKVFVPLPRTLDAGQPATLFDLILADLTPLVRPGRVLIGTGDVLLGVGKHNPDLSARGMVGVAFRGPASTGARHGVYVCDGNGRITDFLQKPTQAQVRDRGALDRRGRLLIDTGILSLDAAAARHWANASATLVRQYRAGTGTAIDLYSELLPALYAQDSNAGRLERFRIPFRAEIVPPCEFLHIGSTVELLSISTKTQSASHQAVRLNSVVSAPLRQHSTSFVESSRITHRTRLGNHGMLVGFPGGLPVHLNDHLGMVFFRSAAATGPASCLESRTISRRPSGAAARSATDQSGIAPSPRPQHGTCPCGRSGPSGPCCNTRSPSHALFAPAPISKCGAWPSSCPASTSIACSDTGGCCKRRMRLTSRLPSSALEELRPLTWLSARRDLDTRA